MINRAIIRGYVADDPLIRATEGGKFARLRVATIERITIQKSGITKEHIEWHTVNLWGKDADIADKEIRIGSALHIEGTIRTSEWEDRAGKLHRTADITADTITLLPTIEGYDVPRSIVEKMELLYPSKTSKRKPTYEIKAPAEDPDDLPF
ncbi:MAG: single-stranded DNA-binding protein [Rikenellaceae bacterium]